MKTLVLSGGGAKGSYQVGVERILRYAGGYSWDRILGVSAGALNAVMLAQHRHEDLLNLWQNLTEKDIHHRYPWWRVLLRIARGELGIWDHTPLWDLICQNAEAARIKVPVHVGYVRVQDGEYVEACSADGTDMRRAIWASASLPVIWPPVEIEGALAIDGGTRHNTPLGRALELGASEVFVVLCNKQRIAPTQRPESVFEVARRALDIAMHEGFVSDIRETLRINALVQQAEAAGVQLKRDSGEPYRYVPITVIEPSLDLGDSLDFSPLMAAARIRIGEADGLRALRKLKIHFPRAGKVKMP